MKEDVVNRIKPFTGKCRFRLSKRSVSGKLVSTVISGSVAKYDGLPLDSNYN